MRFLLTLLAALASPGLAQAGVVVSTEISHPLVVAGAGQTAYLKVGVRGLPKADLGQRAPVNVAIVLDKSGSMQGRKIAEARRAAMLAVERLQPNDIVSIIAYDSIVRVIVPATKARGKQEILSAIHRIQADGQTALFAGVAKGAAELRKFINRERVNRIILLSDGMANVGPASPGELAALGASLSKEGIAVTTIGLGLGYNEDLMARLAQASEGNHAFAEGAEDLARIFNLEFGDLFAVTAQDVEMELICAPGVRPLRVMGREALISGQKVSARLGHLAANQERFLLIEVQLPSFPRGKGHPIANSTVRFRDKDGARQQSLGSVAVGTAGSKALAEASVKKDVMVAVTQMLVAEQNKIAIKLRDEGRKKEAQQVMRRNVQMLKKRAKKYGSRKLREAAPAAQIEFDEMGAGDWNRVRKKMIKRDYKSRNQQSY